MLTKEQFKTRAQEYGYPPEKIARLLKDKVNETHFICDCGRLSEGDSVCRICDEEQYEIECSM